MLVTQRFSRPAVAAMGVLIVILGLPVAWADEVVLRDGRRFQGRVLEETMHTVKFKVVNPSGSSMVRLIPRNTIKDLVIDGTEPTPQPKPEPEPESTPATGSAKPTATPPTEAAPGRPPTRTPSDVENIIKQAGTTFPDWWDSVELNYPDTLDLAGTDRVEGWRPEHNLGAFMWERVNARPKTFRMGAKLLHHVVDFRKGDLQRRAEAMEMLGNVYFHLLNDWARAAYWYKLAFGVKRQANAVSAIALAECYWRLGSRQLAVETLKRYGMDTRRPSLMAIMVWCEMGDAAGAMKMAELLISVPQRADEGYLAAGNVARYQGKLDEAIGYYEEATRLTRGGRYLKMNQLRARENLEAVQLLKTLDLSKVPDGAHEAEVIGYKGPITLRVHVAGGKITRVEIMSHTEDQAHNALAIVGEWIVAQQSLQGIDAVTGASMTGDAVLNATTKALHAAQK